MTKTQRVHKFLTEELTIRAAGVVATQLVEEMRSLQHTYPIATVAVGRALIGSLLMSSHLKHNQELSLYFRGNGPLGSIFAQASYEGKARGYVANPQFITPVESEQIQIGPAIGIGLLTVTHHLPNQSVPHTGTVIIRTGEIGDDIAFYLDQSHQIPSIVSLGVQVDKYGRVEAAGGVLIELMPGVSEESIRLLEQRVPQVPSISKLIMEGAQPEDLVAAFLADFKLIELEHDFPIQYQCRCSLERVKRSVVLLGLQEIESILTEKKPLDVSCEFCGRKYQVSETDLIEMRNDLYKESLN